MKKWLLVGLLLCTPIFAGCPHAPDSIVTPAGKAAYQADQVLLKFSEISNLVKSDTGKGPGEIDASDAFTIIEWISGDDKHRDPATGHIVPTVGLIQVIQTTNGQGWKAAAEQVWQSRIRAIFQSHPAIASYVDVIDALLEVL